MVPPPPPPPVPQYSGPRHTAGVLLSPQKNPDDKNHLLFEYHCVANNINRKMKTLNEKQKSQRSLNSIVAM